MKMVDCRNPAETDPFVAEPKYYVNLLQEIYFNFQNTSFLLTIVISFITQEIPLIQTFAKLIED